MTMHRDLEVRNADKPTLTKGWLLFIFSVLWGFFTIFSFQLFGDLEAVGFAFLGLVIWVFLILRNDKIDRMLEKQHSNYIQSDKEFSCQKCARDIDKPIKYENKDGTPILYHCQYCQILWHVGPVDLS